jgi:hypothetical protein
MKSALKMPFEIDKNWLLILRKAWSMRFVILSAISGVVSQLLPLFDESGSAFAALSTVLAVCAGLSRLIVQPVLREEFKTSRRGIKNLKD